MVSQGEPPADTLFAHPEKRYPYLLQHRPITKSTQPSYQHPDRMSIDSARRADGDSLGTNTDVAVSGCDNSSDAAADEKRRASITLRYELKEAAEILLCKEPEGVRLIACMNIRVDGWYPGAPDELAHDDLVIERDSKSGRARYKNLVHCNSPWVCPICSQRRTEEDKSEVNRAYRAARGKGWIAVMVTYTQQHDHADTLEKLLEVNADARRWMKSNSRIAGDTWQTIKAKYGLQGGIINLETTHGKNAWHPHNHELIFIDPAQAESDDMGELRWLLAQRWQTAVRKHGGDCDIAHGLDLRTGDDAISEYIAKFGHEPRGGWSLESEMTKGSAKIGKEHGRTPFQLLYDYTKNGDLQAGALFVEFAKQFSGKAHLRWSQGLREMLDLENFTDEADAFAESREEATKPEFTPFVAVPGECWKRTILKVRGRRAAFLLACEQGEQEAAETLARWGYTGAVFWLSPPDAPPTLTAKSAYPQNRKFSWEVEYKGPAYHV